MSVVAIGNIIGSFICNVMYYCYSSCTVGLAFGVTSVIVFDSGTVVVVDVLYNG